LGVLQRIHQHYVENISLASIAVVAAGIVKPNYGLGVGLTYMLGRYFYIKLEHYGQYSTEWKREESEVKKEFLQLAYAILQLSPELDCFFGNILNMDLHDHIFKIDKIINPNNEK
jgi:hypothetical protein